MSPGKCYSCLVAFNNLDIALVGKLKDNTGLYLFSGFTSTFVYAPALARRFARWAYGSEDRIIQQLQKALEGAD